MQILCTLLPLFNIIINFGNSDVYAYKDYENGGFDAISVSELACAILPGLVIIYEALFVIGLTVFVFKLNKDMPYKQFWFNAPFDKEHLFAKNRKHTYALIILFTASVICSIIIRALLRKPIFTPCCGRLQADLSLQSILIQCSEIFAHT